MEPNRYVLYVSRLEPENNARLVIEAFKRVRTAYRLLIVGDAPYAEEYISDLKARAKGRLTNNLHGVRFRPGLQGTTTKRVLLRSCNRSRRNSSCAGRSNGYGNCVLTLATPENIEVVGDAGIPYADEFDLSEKLQRVLRDGSLVQDIEIAPSCESGNSMTGNTLSIGMSNYLLG